MQKEHKGVIYFSTRQEAKEMAETLEGREHLAWGEVTEVVPRIVEYQLGYAVQYSRSNAYYPAPLLPLDEDREEPDSCGETITYWEQFDYDQ